MVVVLVFLIPNPHFGMLNIGGGCGQSDGDLDAIGILEDKVLCNQGNGVRVVTAKRVGDVSVVT